MPAMRYTLSLGDMVSDDLRAAARRRVREIVGIGVIGIAGIAALALATWSVQDPSFSHATNAPVRNALGLVGAASADLMMQILGIATVALLLPVASWGWRLLTHRSLERQRIRAILWVAGTIAAAGFASCLAPSKSWPLPTGLGGVVGDSLLHVPAWVFGPLSGAPRFVIAIMLGVAAFATLALASGFGLRRKEDDEDEVEEKPAKKAAKQNVEDDGEEEREPRSFVSLGWLYHFLYSVKARIVLLPTMLLGWLPWRRRPRVVALRHDPVRRHHDRAARRGVLKPGRRSGRRSRERRRGDGGRGRSRPAQAHQTGRGAPRKARQGRLRIALGCAARGAARHRPPDTLRRRHSGERKSAGERAQ